MDRACFERIYTDYYKVLRFFAMRVVGDMPHAEDIVQEVFTHCWENREQIDASIPIKSYLYTLTYRRALDLLKSSQYARKDLSEDVSYLDNLLFTTFTADEQLSTDEIKKEIILCVELLPDRCKEVFMMSRFQNLKNREIAEKLNITVKAVEKHISKALKDIRAHLLRNGYMPVAAFILSLPSIITPPHI
ncbi:RNA polymerase sigma-70 factor [Bacteroides helcogenes]|uniref:RNA polymerase sigma-70 factor n=1 Tax=Bacteroides helcogenes TaxID=290053 RepID=UPI002A909EE9|nr:RNA polymerase sigma-70 factor [Bacteroides helcogenes]MDY5237238.1 RNA polymerase sigma-70 factor [Bacteroides helcogenes]